MNSGFTSQLATMGQVNNWGIEMELSSKNIDNGFLNGQQEYSFR